MESNGRLRETDIKNRKYYFFNHIIKIVDFNLDNIFNR